MQILKTIALAVIFQISVSFSAHALPSCPNDTDAIWTGCSGSYRFEGGDVYIGHWHNNQPHGIGKFIWSDGDQYMGEIRNGEMEGQGVYSRGDGQTFAGGFSSNRRHGKGYYIWRNGTAGFCNYVDGKAQNCTGNNAGDVAPELSTAFRVLTRQERREAQTILKSKGYYSGSVDGLWGKNTFVAVLSFAVMEMQSHNSRSRSGAVRILDAILDGTNRGKNQPSGNVSCYTDPSRCPEDKLCTIAAQQNGTERIWRNEKTSKFVAAAKQRGLTCGVEQTIAKPAEPAVPPSAPEVDQAYKVASGTGFFVSEDGHLITNDHVIDGCKEIKIHLKGEIFDTVTLANDPQNDLALLKSDAT